ncbi:uncharacterized protein LOC132633358 isoform X1 [Lycium barbarum]|uniref:uncharacterized protein LOC132633358 isoform X1 n=1 Tax=Lycium barbarum TaxID=112863 RepID=UPI00293EE7C4|nr:uncharacterized protein LOC132633358 isoform X1 [Lycium barbarum]
MVVIGFENHMYCMKRNGFTIGETQYFKGKLQDDPKYKVKDMRDDPPALVKLAGRPRIKRDRGKDEALKRQGEWKLSRKGSVMTCSNCGEPNHNVRSCGKPKKGKQPAKKRQPARGKKRQTRGLVDEDENSQVEEEINLTAPQPTQDSQSMPSSSTLFPNFEYPSVEEDDEDPFLRPIVISEFSTRLQMRQKAQEPTGRRAISFRGDHNGVSEAANLPVSLTSLTWQGNDAVTTSQLEAKAQERIGKLNPRRGPNN